MGTSSAFTLNILKTAQLFKPFNGCLQNIVRIVGPKALGQNIFYAGHLHDCPDGTTGDNSGTRCSWLHEHPACAVTADNLVRDCTVNKWKAHHGSAGMFNGLAYSLRDLASLTQSATDSALSVTDNDQRAEAESPTALHDFCHPVYMYNTIDQIGFLLTFKHEVKPP
jgi:hypothetical protein